jgi:hypothetical protein
MLRNNNGLIVIEKVGWFASVQGRRWGNSGVIRGRRNGMDTIKPQVAARSVPDNHKKLKIA